MKKLVSASVSCVPTGAKILLPAPAFHQISYQYLHQNLSSYHCVVIQDLDTKKPDSAPPGATALRHPHSFSHGAVRGTTAAPRLRFCPAVCSSRPDFC